MPDRAFEEWVAQRNESNANESSQCPVDLLQKADFQELNIWLCRFVTEVRKQDGKLYPPRSIHLILAGIQRYIWRLNLMSKVLRSREFCLSRSSSNL